MKCSVYVTRHNNNNVETFSEITTDTIPDLLIPTHLFVAIIHTYAYSN